AEADSDLLGFRYAKDNFRISHLFFADDNLVFTHTTTQDAETLYRILLWYEKASGQKINLEKYAITLVQILIFLLLKLFYKLWVLLQYSRIISILVFHRWSAGISAKLLNIYLSASERGFKAGGECYSL
ncbi:hypothetical protein PanWU01x14_179980, partial [Parasponia andersonii]